MSVIYCVGVVAGCVVSGKNFGINTSLRVVQKAVVKSGVTSLCGGRRVCSSQYETFYDQSAEEAPGCEARKSFSYQNSVKLSKGGGSSGYC